MKLQTIVSCLVLFFVAPAYAPGDVGEQFEEIRITNNSPVTLNVWFWKAGKKIWIQPSVACEPQETLTVRLAGKRYYLVVTTNIETPETFVIGWVDVGKLRSRSELPTLTLDGTLVQRTKEEVYTVCKSVWETRTKDVPVMRLRIIDGQRRWVEKTITKTYKVTKMVKEQRVRSTVVESLDLHPSFSDSQGQLTSQVTFKTNKSGAFIKYKLAGRDEIYIARNPTDSTDRLPVGIYVIWTERDQKRTSSKERYDIYRENEEITIPEMTSTP